MMKKIYIIILILIITTIKKSYSYEDLTLIEKWNIMLSNFSPYFNDENFESQFCYLEYLRCFKSEINSDLTLLNTTAEIKQYVKFIKHISELTSEYYDLNSRSYGAAEFYVRKLHYAQWNYWYSITLIRS